MIVFHYMIRLYNQDVSVGAVAESAIKSRTNYRGSTAESAHSRRGRTNWNTVINYLLSTIAKVTDVVADRCNECW
jgi:hypothetical protein